MNRHSLLRAVTGVAAVSTATAAQAESAPTAILPAPASMTAAKTEAILGGSSSLAAILAQQGAVSPASRGLARVQYRPAVDSRTLRPALEAKPAIVSRTRPDLFGSVALRIDRTPLDDKWRSVSRAGAPQAHAAFAVALRGAPELERIQAVNRYVNARVRFTDDAAREDRWATAEATLRRGRGDCEDYAIAKLQLLRAAGFADRDLYFVVLRDLVRRADHAVLAVRVEDLVVVLDNGTDQLLNSDDIRDYRPIFTYTATGRWTHGYRRQPQPVELAAANMSSMIKTAR